MISELSTSALVGELLRRIEAGEIRPGPPVLISLILAACQAECPGPIQGNHRGTQPVAMVRMMATALLKDRCGLGFTAIANILRCSDASAATFRYRRHKEYLDAGDVYYCETWNRILAAIPAAKSHD